MSHFPSTRYRSKAFQLLLAVGVATLSFPLLALGSVQATTYIAQADVESEARSLWQDARRLLEAERYSEAIPVAEELLDLVSTELGDDHPNVAIVMQGLGQLYTREGRYEDAEPLLQQALGIRESQLGENHVDVAASLDNLAKLYGAQGRYEDAEPLLQRALSIREDQLGENHVDVAASLDNLAKLYGAQGRYEDAEPLAERATSIRDGQP